jgi:hypothetical protein
MGGPEKYPETATYDMMINKMRQGCNQLHSLGLAEQARVYYAALPALKQALACRQTSCEVQKPGRR